jgi:hypothetical protein
VTEKNSGGRVTSPNRRHESAAHPDHQLVSHSKTIHAESEAVDSSLSGEQQATIEHLREQIAILENVRSLDAHRDARGDAPRLHRKRPVTRAQSLAAASRALRRNGGDDAC